jgi:hypothetical protein
MTDLDTLTLKGFGKTDGEYRFDLFSLINIGGRDALTSREQHRIRQVAGVRGAEVVDAVTALDAATMVVLAAVILERQGRAVTEERLWNTRMVYGSTDDVSLDDYTDAVLWRITDRNTVETQEDEAGPPAVTPPPNDKQSSSGGVSSLPTLVPPENDPSPTGNPDSERSAISAPQTSAI